MGYQSGDFTVVYPLVRALPVLFVALFDLARGRAPSGAAWVGMSLVALGCLLIPHTTWRTLRWQAYRSRAILWAVLAALGTVGYSAADKVAAEYLMPGAVDAARYFVLELVFCMPPLVLLLRLAGQPIGLQPWRAGWRWPLLAALGTFLSYWLILWAFQGVAQASYIVAIRQSSIVIGTVLGTFLFHEPARGLRIPAALLITGGIITIALAG
jgi:drug/metabolite transporter (DMT)-like permease